MNITDVRVRKVAKEGKMKAVVSIIGSQTALFTDNGEENAYWSHLRAERLRETADVFEIQNHSWNLHEYGERRGCLRRSGEDEAHYAKLLHEDTECFCFLAGHESFAAAEGAIGIAEKANKVRQKPLRVILNGLGKDAAKIISRINGFTFVETSYDPYTNTVTEVERIAYSEGLRAKVNCYGANSVPEGVAIMWKENVDVSITGNSTNPTRFQHPVAGTYKKERLEAGKKYFSVASGGGTGRTLHPDNMAAGPASYGFTDTLGRMHSDAQFAGSSSVPAHVEMMGLIGMGNNPMVGATVAVAVSIEEAAKAGKF